MSLIHHAAIMVADLERSERFYGELLGLTPNPPEHKRELFHLAFELPPERSFDEFVAELADRAIRVIRGPVDHPRNVDGSGSRPAVYLFDPDGYLVEVTQEA